MIPAPLEHFADLFNRGSHWESHEVLEGPWREEGSPFYHGLILYASAFVHHASGNAHGVRAQLGKAARALEPYRPRHLGVDVDRLLEHGREVRETVRSDPDGWRERTGPPRLTLDPALVRGDEPELADSPG